ncbi:MAG: tetratricopeptide repeat protein [Kiritimatiellia bacterium]
MKETFYTLTLLEKSPRAYAFFDAARQKEKEAQFKEALDIYQRIIDEYPAALGRVSRYGNFVPIALVLNCGFWECRSRAWRCIASNTMSVLLRHLRCAAFPCCFSTCCSPQVVFR